MVLSGSYSADNKQHSHFLHLLYEFTGIVKGSNCYVDISSNVIYCKFNIVF